MPRAVRASVYHEGDWELEFEVLCDTYGEAARLVRLLYPGQEFDLPEGGPDYQIRYAGNMYAVCFSSVDDEAL